MFFYANIMQDIPYDFFILYKLIIIFQFSLISWSLKNFKSIGFIALKN